MNDKQLGAALLQLDATELGKFTDTQKLTWQILQQDRRRVRWWTILTILTWLPAVICALGVLVYLGLLFPLQAKLQQMRDAAAAVEKQEGKKADPPRDEAHRADKRLIDIDQATPEQLAQLERDTEIAFKMMTVITALAVLTLSLALLSSVLLIFATRRATLRQINASLLVISEQLKKPAA
jgi:hypothetical protein